MRANLRQLLDQSGISSVFKANSFAQTIGADGTNLFTYRSFEFMFHVSRYNRNQIYCDQFITGRYGGDVLPGWKRALRPEDLPDLRKKLEDIYIPNIMRIKVEFPLDVPLEDMKAYLIPRFDEIGYQYFEEYSGERILNIVDYKRPELNERFAILAFSKGAKIARVLIEEITKLVYIDLLWYPEEPDNPRIVKVWHECVSPFVSKYELLDGLVRWVSQNEDRI